MTATRDEGPRVLVVDDEEGLRSLLEYRLRQHDFTVESAIDGKAGLDVLSSRGSSFDAIVLDLSMPKMDGFELLRRMKPLDLDLVTIVLSGRHSEEEQIKALDLGADDYIQKPFSPKVLITKLNHRLG